MGGTGQFAAFAFLAACAGPALADECVDPYKRTVLSPAKTFAIQFTPQKRDCSDDSCSDNPKITGELEGHPNAPTLTLLELGSGGKKKQKWSKLLLDGYEPMGMAVSDDGKYAIMADRWCVRGLGKDVVVLLGSDGAYLQSWSLSQLLPDTYSEALYQTSPNIHWREEISYDPAARGFNFQVAIARGQNFHGGSGYLTFLLDPERRSFTAREPAAWNKAFAYAEGIVRNRCAMRKWRLARAAIPLTAPAGTDGFVWMNFAMELEERVIFPKLENFSWKQRLFLSAPSDASYQDDLKEFRRVLTMTRANIPGDFYLVSPDLANAHAILKSFLAGEEDKNLGNDRFVIMGDEPAASEVAATIAKYGGHQWKIIGLREAVPPLADRKDYDWQGKRACAAIGEEKL